MFKNVVVGVDEYQGGRDAIALAMQLVGLDAKMTLAYVYPGDMRPWRGESAAHDAVELERALEMLAKVRDDECVSAELRGVRAQSVGRALHVLAEEIGADLLAVGSSHHGLIGRVMLGDDTGAALNGAPCAVAIAPVGHSVESGVIREVGVGYNGSAESAHALAVARRLAAQHGAKLSAIEVVSVPAYAFAGGPAPVEDAIEKLIDDARGRIAAIDGVEPHAAYGVPADELALYSGSLDLLVVGSRDYGPVGRLVHGSTSRRLARSARCPLLVLTRAARAAHPTTSLEDNQDAVGAAAS